MEALAWGLFAGSSLVIGAALVFLRAPSTRVLGLVMGFGAGVLLSAVSFELVDEAVTVPGGERGATIGFFVGAFVFFAGDTAIARFTGHGGRDASRPPPQGGAGDSSALSIVLGTVLDGIPESAVLGLTLLQTGDIGISMLVAVFVSNLPEAIAATTDLLREGWGKAHVLMLWTGIAGVSGFAAAAGYALLDGASPTLLAFTLAFAGGAILAMLSTSMIPEAYEAASRVVGLVVTLGFAVAFAINWVAS